MAVVGAINGPSRSFNQDKVGKYRWRASQALQIGGERGVAHLGSHLL